MGRFFGKRWKIDGVTAGPISRHYPANGRYSVIFERDDAFLEQIEKINWAKPTIQRLSEDANEQGLPEVVFHSLRHTSVTYKLKLSGGDIKVVQGDSGHAQADMVTEVYGHIIDEDRRRA